MVLRKAYHHDTDGDKEKNRLPFVSPFSEVYYAFKNGKKELISQLSFLQPGYTGNQVVVYSYINL